MNMGPVYEMETIGKNLRRLRKENHYSVEDIRQYLQLETVQAVYKYERGRSLPPAEKLLALMKLYGAGAEEVAC